MKNVIQAIHTNKKSRYTRRRRRRKNTKHLEKKGLGNQHVQCVGKREEEEEEEFLFYVKGIS